MPDKVLISKKVFIAFFVAILLAIIPISLVIKDNKLFYSPDVEEALCEFEYIALNPLTQEELKVQDEFALFQSFEQLKDLHVTTVIQPFGVRVGLQEWKWFLNKAEENNIKVVASFVHETDNVPNWTGESFKLGNPGLFLNEMKGHPALVGFMMIEEPYHESKHGGHINTERLQQLYLYTKETSEDVPLVVNFSDQIALGESREDDFNTFKDNMCDTCLISALPFRNTQGSTSFDTANLNKSQIIAREAVRREDPGVVLWSSIQVFGTQNGVNYYMPSPSELEEAIDIVLSPTMQTKYPVTGLVLQQWKPVHESQYATGIKSLSDDDQKELRDLLKVKYEDIQNSCARESEESTS